MPAINPKNVTAQIRYEAVGNPTACHPQAAVGNFFPGLEFNFLNVWKRIFSGLELLESSGQVIGVEPHMPDEIKELVGGYLVKVDDLELTRQVEGPRRPDATSRPPTFFLEWSNALAKLHSEKGVAGETAACTFVVFEQGSGTVKGPFDLKVNRLVKPDSALIRKKSSLPGEVTESLCSPWQTDYVGCACYYWASNRPDYVNVEKEESDDGTEVSHGHHWLNIERRNENGKPFYTLVPDENLEHEDVMQDWESKFQFVVKGRDVPDGVVPAPDATDDETG